MSRNNLTECRWANDVKELDVEENRQLIWETPEVFAGALNVRVLTSTIDATR